MKKAEYPGLFVKASLKNEQETMVVLGHENVCRGQTSLLFIFHCC